MRRYVEKCCSGILFILTTTMLVGCSYSKTPISSIDSNRKPLLGMWETIQLNSKGQIDFAEASKLRLAICSSDEMYLFAVYPDGMVYRCFDTQPTRIVGNCMYLGPIGSCLRFQWSLRRNHLVWAKEEAQEFQCTFKRVGDVPLSVSETWRKCPDSYFRFSKYFFDKR